MSKQTPVIPQTKIIELRQGNMNSLVHADGDYSVNLMGREVTLNEGDQLQLKSCFLDTATASGSGGYIELQPDDPQPDDAPPDEPQTTIKISVGKYMINAPSIFETSLYTTQALHDAGTKTIIPNKIYNPSFNSPVQVANTTIEDIRGRCDGKPYVLCSGHQQSNAANTNHKKLNALVVGLTVDKAHGPGSKQLLNLPLAIFVYANLPPVASGTPITPGKGNNVEPILRITTNPTALDAKLATQQLATDSGSIVIDAATLERFPGFFSKTDDIFGMTIVGDGAADIVFIQDPSMKIGKRVGDITVSPITDNVPDQTLTLQPVIETLQFTLPSGKYESAEIARRITEEASRASFGGDIPIDDNIPTNNPMYRSFVDQMRQVDGNKKFQRKDAANTAPNVPPVLGEQFVGGDASTAVQYYNVPMMFVEMVGAEAAAGTPRTQFNGFTLTNYLLGDLDYMVGNSSGFVLEYDDATAKFSIDSLHTPVRNCDPNGGNPLGQPEVRAYVRPVKDGNGDLTDRATKYVQNAYGGVFITNLEPTHLWKDQMKLDPSIVTKVESDGVIRKMSDITTGNPGEDYAVTGNKIVLEIGKNITGGIDNVGIAEQSVVSTTHTDGATPPNTINDPTNPNFGCYEVAMPFSQGVADNDFNIPAGFLATGITQGIPLFGGFQVDDGQHAVQDEGYYKIVVDSKVRTEVLGSDNLLTSVSAIVSKYNSYGSFTSSYDEGSITYTHRGQPITLTDFRVRVLLPDGDLATDLNDRNAVFLEVIKNS